MGRESSHGRKELFNLPPLVLKARAPNDGSAFCIGFSRLEVPEQTLGGIPLGLGMVMKINFFEFSCMVSPVTEILRGVGGGGGLREVRTEITQKSTDYGFYRTCKSPFFKSSMSLKE